MSEIAGELVVLNEQAGLLKERLLLTRDKLATLIRLESDLPFLARIPDLDHQVRALRYEIGRLDRKSIEALRAEVERVQLEQRRWQDEAKQLDQSIGGLEMSLRPLEGETIPQLERAADEAMQSARQFILTENGIEQLDEAEHEYARRRERQPLETILLNATRYEGDQQTAEQRSSTQLQTAKKECSVTFEFGFDDDADARRYTQERQRLEESELPQ